MEEIESNRLTTDAIESQLTRLEAEIERMREKAGLSIEELLASLREQRERRGQGDACS